MKSKDTQNQFKNDRNHINVGTIIFALILLYVFVCLYLSSKESRIIGYQVKNGTLSENHIYTGIALRNEYPVQSADSGYVSLFVREGERAAHGDLIYAIDETSKFSDVVGKTPDKDSALTPRELESLKQDIMLFSKDFDETNFEYARNFERLVNNDLDRIESRELMLNVDEINSLHLNDVINFFYSIGFGIVTYYKDGYEMAQSSNLTEKDFNQKNYEATYIENDSLVEEGSFIYKYCNDENWSLCILVSKEMLSRLEEDDYVEVEFSKTRTRSWGRIHIATATEEGAIVELKFTNSMVTFAPDRFVEIELLLEEDTGLKVPNSAIADNSFFLIDKPYVFENQNTGEMCVNRQVIESDGQVSEKIMTVNVYNETDTEYYVSMSGLNVGDVLYYVEGTGTKAGDTPISFTVGKQGTLIGVYNINKGYADFKQVEILYSNDEYSIVKSYSKGGLRAYDYIALDASVVTDKDFVY